MRVFTSFDEEACKEDLLNLIDEYGEDLTNIWFRTLEDELEAGNTKGFAPSDWFDEMMDEIQQPEVNIEGTEQIINLNFSEDLNESVNDYFYMRTLVTRFGIPAQSTKPGKKTWQDNLTEKRLSKASYKWDLPETFARPGYDWYEAAYEIFKHKLQPFEDFLVEKEFAIEDYLTVEGELEEEL